MKKIKYIVYILMTIGAILVGAGLILIFNSGLDTIEGIMRIAILIGLGMFFIVPSKIFLTLQLMANKE